MIDQHKKRRHSIKTNDHTVGWRDLLRKFTRPDTAPCKTNVLELDSLSACQAVSLLFLETSNNVRYRVPEFPHSSATFNIILGSRIQAFS